MSVEKLFDSSQTLLEENPYTQICNSVTEFIKDNDAYRLYCYLSSKSREWAVIKEWTAKVCHVGEGKSKKCWSYLERCSLIEYITIRNEKGKFIKHDIRVLNGTKFNPDEPFLNPTKKPTGAETEPVDETIKKIPNIHRVNNPPSGLSTRVVFAPLLNKDIKNKDSELKKEKSFCLSDEQKKRKAENEKKPEWASGKKSPMASVEDQSTSYNKTKIMKTAPEPSKHVIEYQKRQAARAAKPANELLAGTEVPAEIPSTGNNGGQGAAIAVNRGKGNPSQFRGRHGLLAACSARLHPEETGMACHEGAGALDGQRG